MPNNHDDIINIKYKKSTKYPLMPLEKERHSLLHFQCLKDLMKQLKKKKKWKESLKSLSI